MQPVDSFDKLPDAVMQGLEPDGALTPRFLIVSDHDRGHAWRRVLAGDGRFSMLGLAICTLPEFAEHLWGLLGDHRSIVDDATRTVLSARSLERCAGLDAALPVSAGMARSIASSVRTGACYPGFRDALTLSDTPVSRVMTGYLETIREQGMIEYGEALQLVTARLLDPDAAGPELRVVQVELPGLTPLEESLLEACSAVEVTVDPKADGDDDAIRRLAGNLYRDAGAMEPDPSIRFAFASGRYAEPDLIADVVAGVVDGHGSKVAVVSPHPGELMMRVAPRLADRRIPSGGELSTLFADTPVGRAFLDLVQVVRHSSAPETRRADAIARVADLARNPTCHLDLSRVLHLDKRYRSDRSLPVHGMVEQLGKWDSRLLKVIRLVENGRDADALASLHALDLASGGNGDLLSRALDARATASGTAFLEAAATAGLGERVTLALLGDIRVSAYCVFDPASNRLSPGSDPAAHGERPPTGTGCASVLPKPPLSEVAQVAGGVMFCTLGYLASHPVRAAVICELDSAAYPLVSKGDPLKGLFSSVGIGYRDTRLDDIRSLFRRAVNSVGDVIVFERPLADEDGGEVRPSALLEEVVDCLDPDPTDPGTIDERTGIPKHLLGLEVEGRRIVCERGEDRLDELVSRPYGARSARGEDRLDELVSRPYGARSARGEDRPDARAVHPLLAYDQVRHRVAGSRMLSTSQVERYLSCPHRWFLERKVNPMGLDSENDAMAYGDFDHMVLERFYTPDRDSPPRRVSPSTLEEDLARLDRCFDSVRDENGREVQRPIVVATELESRVLEEHRMRLHGFIEDESGFLPGFTPVHLEYAFGADGECLFAGMPFNGRIDRIDLSDEVGSDGRRMAVVIDYKGSLDKEYSPALDEESGVVEIPHIQSLVYASMVEKLLGVRVVGSLYRSYRDCSVQGVYDARVLGPLEIHAKHAFRVLGHEGFEELYSIVGTLVANASAGMEAGLIPRSPSRPSSCRYCPAVGCDQRIGV